MKGQTNAKLASKGIQGESVNITLLTNQESHSDLIGAVITVTYGGVDTEYVWEGSEVTVKIPAMMDYSISVSEMEGYATPEGFSATSQMGYSRKLEMTYNTELVTINVSSDEGSVSGYEITILKVEKIGLNNEYTRVEYIESTGVQYIDTGFKPNNNTRVVVDMQAFEVNANGWAFGGRDSTSKNSMGVFYYYSSNKLWNADYYGSSQRKSFSGIGATDRITIDFNKNICSINGVSNTFTATTFQSSYPMALFAVNTANTVSTFIKARLYSCKIYDNDILVRDFVPVKNSSGVAGMLDMVENKFYPSNSTTAFNAGTVVGEIIKEESVFNTLYTQTPPSASYKIPYGTPYIVKASDVSGYITPSEQSFTASQPSRNVDVMYESKKFGVLIYDIDGRLTYPENWNTSNNSKAVGVAILTDSCEFVVAKEDAKSSSVYWGGYGTDISTLTNYTDAANAATDFDGIGNTAKIIAAIGNTADNYRTGTAAGDCAEYTFPNEKTGYLGAAGEWKVARQNKDALNSALTLIGGTTMTEAAYWTSTELEGHYACTQWFDSRDLLFHRIKSDGRSYIRAFTIPT